MLAEPRGDGGDTIVEISKGRMLSLGTKNRWTLRIIPNSSA
jgi:hypothetical protein